MSARLLYYIIISSLFSIGLVIFRIIYTGQFSWFVYLIWNLFLAWIPFLLALLIYKYFYKMPGEKSRRPIYIISLIILISLWLIFLPNTYYIVTDFIHLKDTKVIGLWYDLLLISSFAFNGMMLGFASTFLVQKVLIKRIGYQFAWLFIMITFFLSSFGIYLGRFLRWNSWDVIANPLYLMWDIYRSIFTPGILSKSYGITIIFSIMLLVIYAIIWEFGKEKESV